MPTTPLKAIYSAVERNHTARAKWGAIANHPTNTISDLFIQAEYLQTAESRISILTWPPDSGTSGHVIAGHRPASTGHPVDHRRLKENEIGTCREEAAHDQR